MSATQQGGHPREDRSTRGVGGAGQARLPRTAEGQRAWVRPHLRRRGRHRRERPTPRACRGQAKR
eukprot:10527602-Alexandrium_andersonii.AAC.1